MLVTVLVQCWEGNEDYISVFDSLEKAEKYLAAYCREEWTPYDEDAPKELSKIDKDAIDVFYDGLNGEWYDIQTAEVQ